MSRFLIVVILITGNFVYGQHRTAKSDVEKLDAYLLKNVSYFALDGNIPRGEGWRVMESLFEGKQFVAWGEYHNSPMLSQLAAYALLKAKNNGFDTFCVETSPFIAGELSRIANSPSPADTLSRLFKTGYPNIGNIAFFKSKHDAQLLSALNHYHFKIWGVDQEFQMSFQYCIDKIYNAQSVRFLKKYKPLRDSLVAKWWYPDTKLLDSLEGLVKQSKFKDALKDIKISKEIYRESDNQARALLMKSNFYNYYAKSTQSKVFFKLGSNHLAKGINLQTHLYDLGNAIYELALRNGTKFTNVYFMTRYSIVDGKLIDDLKNSEPENPEIFTRIADPERWVVIDVQKFLPFLSWDHTLTNNTYALLEKYDYIVISPEIAK